MDRSADVLVVGAGPTGLLLAGDLARAGAAVTLLERRQEESNLTRAFAVHARTLEVLDARDLADALVQRGQPVPSLRLFGRVEVTLTALPSRFPFVLVTPQYEVEALLQRRALEAGVHLVRGAEVTGLSQDPDGVELAVSPHQGPGGRWRARYAVGTDGAHSTLRRALGLPFPGRSAVRSVVLADVRLQRPPADVLTVGAVAEGFAFLAPFGDGWYRVIAWDRRRQLPDDAPVDWDELCDIVRLALGDVGLHSPRWTSRFSSDERQAPTYRGGRVLLAGDAAHVHSPAGGQGMNTGLQDAANLSWKLAAVVRGGAPEDLLDSYDTERHPVGAQVLRTSDRLLRLAMVEHRPLRTARDRLGALLTRVPVTAHRLAGTVSGITVRYPPPPGADPSVGSRAADLPLLPTTAGHDRLHAALRPGRLLLAVPVGEAVPDPLPAGPGAAVEVVRSLGAGRASVLVRPDGYLAWAGSTADAGDVAALRAALALWGLG